MQHPSPLMRAVALLLRLLVTATPSVTSYFSLIVFVSSRATVALPPLSFLFSSLRLLRMAAANQEVNEGGVVAK